MTTPPDDVVLTVDDVQFEIAATDPTQPQDTNTPEDTDG